MNDDNKEKEFDRWFSTYGLLTAERVLGWFDIRLSHKELIDAVKNKRNIYHQLLRIPLKNTLNGIIRQQAYDYQVYAQKLFIDFLVSGQNDVEEGSPGEDTREELEDERTHLVDIGKSFNEQERAHYKLIADTQAKLINLAAGLQKILNHASKNAVGQLKKDNVVRTADQVKRAIQSALIQYSESTETLSDESNSFWEGLSNALDTPISTELQEILIEELAEFNDYRTKIDDLLEDDLELVNQMTTVFIDHRRQFYDLILRTKKLIYNLSTYSAVQESEDENLEAISFDPSIGER